MNPTPSVTTGHKTERERRSETDQGRDSDRDRQNRGRRSSMHSSFETSPSNLRKLVTTHLGSPSSSSGDGSDTASFRDGASSIYSLDGNDSVFSEPDQRTRRPRANNFRYSDMGAQLPHKPKTHHRRGSLFQRTYDPAPLDRASGIADSHEVDDYPHPRSLPHHVRLHHGTPDHGDDSHYDDHTAVSYVQRPQLMPPRRNSVQVPFSHHDPTPQRFQPHRTLSYPVAEPLPSPTYTHTYPQPRYITEITQDPTDSLQVQEVVAATLEALQQKGADAVEHMQRAQAQSQAQAQRRPFLRRNTVSARGPTREFDEWANAPMPVYERGSGRGYRAPMVRA